MPRGATHVPAEGLDLREARKHLGTRAETVVPAYRGNQKVRFAHVPGEVAVGGIQRDGGGSLRVERENPQIHRVPGEHVGFCVLPLPVERAVLIADKAFNLEGVFCESCFLPPARLEPARRIDAEFSAQRCVERSDGLPPIHLCCAEVVLWAEQEATEELIFLARRSPNLDHIAPTKRGAANARAVTEDTLTHLIIADRDEAHVCEQLVDVSNLSLLVAGHFGAIDAQLGRRAPGNRRAVLFDPVAVVQGAHRGIATYCGMPLFERKKANTSATSV